ncbi:alkylation response protein AidB-like acyl-CoA dehydrogenase [Tamaricihabitans halophyticus]|uniref:Alkylation response protein AidB-like acyl-CoA dehydrogenase n=1 Tax=Tamaricihabitans halophyticus TaxID=1262583 RepID=A0A4R2QA28_9PSEU|nr:acyl-CoA dehydrogenase family protein [Tamaricihabitans halophyticus]TCP45777.1 alkylation response protein AidB-like acyl-CoA dehydrogenase [Tamaricihabitans halophyticus]
MPRILTDEQQDLINAVSEFCRRECGTKEQRDKLTVNGQEPHNQRLYTTMAELGWLGILIPEEYGGAGLGMTELCLFLEETAYGRAPISGFATTIIAAASYQKFGTEEQKRVVLDGVVRGRIEAISMSEPGAGSDVAALACRADRVDGGYLLNGQKTWCSNAHIADHILLIARTSKEDSKHKGLTQFMLPTDIDGLQISGIETMGGREVNDLYLTDCFVPDSAVVGTPGKAWTQLTAGLNLERMILGAMMLGVARRAFDDTVDYVRNRDQFGQPIGTFQTLKHRIADMATELECARLLLSDVATAIDANPGMVFPREASMVKLKCTELAKHVALEGMQMMGGYGYATEFGMEALLRSAVVSTVYGGTSEIQRDIIGKTYGL